MSRSTTAGLQRQPSNRIRVALVGYGKSGRQIHRPLLAADPAYQITHVVTSNAARRALARSELPDAQLCRSTRDLFAREEEFEVAVVATGGRTHVSVARTALSLGKAVLVEKPLATSAREARALRAEGGLLVPFHNRRWDSDTLSAQKIVSSGALGHMIRLRSNLTRLEPLDPGAWRESSRRGGGVLLDLGSHLVDQAELLLGPASRVRAHVASRRGGPVEDDALLTLLHESGATSRLWCSLVAPPAPRLSLLFEGGRWMKPDLDGQEAALAAGLPPGTLTRPEPPGLCWRGGQITEQPSVPGDWRALYAGFRAAFRGEEPPPVLVEDAVRGLLILEAARRSATEGQYVDVVS